MTDRVLIALPARNEEAHLLALAPELAALRAHGQLDVSLDVVVVDDGSTDGTMACAAEHLFEVVHHESTRGYGASIAAAIQFAHERAYDFVITMDADGQHLTDQVPNFIRLRRSADVVSGSRYLPHSPWISQPLAPHINQFLTGMVNDVFALSITDVGCGMKGISVDALGDARFTQRGYLFPLEFWAHCWQRRCTIQEVAVPMIYLDRTKTLQRKFGSLDVLFSEAVQCIVDATLRLGARGWTLPHAAEASGECTPADLARALALVARRLREGKARGLPVELALRNVQALSEKMRV